MRKYAFAVTVIVLLLAAVACQTILPETPVVRRIITPTEPGRGVRGGEIGVLVDPTATPTTTLIPGLWLYRTGSDSPPDCRDMILSASPTAEPVWTRVTTGKVSGDISNHLLLCNTNQGILELRITAIGKEKGHSQTLYWRIQCDFEATGGCSESTGFPWEPTKTALGDCGIAGHPYEYQSQTRDMTLGSWVAPGERDNAFSAFMYSGAISGFGCPAESYHGYEIEILSTATPEVYDRAGYIVEINGTQDITPTTSVMLDYNLRGGKGANDEFVEVWCPTPRSMAGWSLTDGTSSYVYAQDNFCEPLKVIFCDEMQDCDLETGFPSTGTWYLYDETGAELDVRYYPTMATPGNSWAAFPYTNPGRPWHEFRPNPGSYQTATPTLTPTYTATPTATPTVTPTP